MASGDSSGSDSSGPGSALPIGVERVLTRATRDAEFRADLRERRGAAADDAGIKLTAAERAVLSAIDEKQLDRMISHLEDRVVEVPRSEIVAAPGGIRPEMPAGIRPNMPLVLGIRPDQDSSSKVRLSPGVVKGIRPGLPLMLAAGAVVVGGASALLCVMAGNRPDEPPRAEPTEPLKRKSEDSSTTAPDAGEPDGGDGGVATDDH